MPAPKILVIPGSGRAGSDNARLAALAAKELTLADADVTMISLADYPLPIYDHDEDGTSNAASQAVKLKRMIAAHHGVFLTTGEFNASVPPFLLNALAWVTRASERDGTPHGAFRGRVFALGATTRDSTGGIRALLALRQVLEIGCGALVLPEQIAISTAEQAFDEMDNLKDEQAADLLRAIARRLVELSWERLDA
jgi:NAD(P)H-dependent FMN reductase